MSKLMNVFKKASKQAEDRITNPLAFAFIIAWLFFNYELVFYILSDFHVQDKIELIRKRFAGPEFWLNGIIWPATLSLLYLGLWLPKILYGVANAHITNLHDSWVLAANESTNPFAMKRELKLRRVLLKNWAKFNNKNFFDLLKMIREDPTKRLALITKNDTHLNLEYNGVIVWSASGSVGHIILKEVFYSFYESGLTETNEEITELSKLAKSDLFLSILDDMLVEKIG